MKSIIEIKVGSKSMRLVKGDITERNVDAIVNAANSRLQHGGGVAGAIVRKGGAVIQDESDKIGFVKVGHAAMTTGGKLPAKFVIHTVGPRMGEGDEDDKLRNAVNNTLRLASEKGLESLSMPAISAGIFGFPKDGCASILVNETYKYLKGNPASSLDTVEFCVFDDEAAGHFKREMEGLK